MGVGGGIRTFLTSEHQYFRKIIFAILNSKFLMLNDRSIII